MERPNKQPLFSNLRSTVSISPISGWLIPKQGAMLFLRRSNQARYLLKFLEMQHIQVETD